jgi:phosphoglycerate dehydrogenase-like enzyme
VLYKPFRCDHVWPCGKAAPSVCFGVEDSVPRHNMGDTTCTGKTAGVIGTGKIGSIVARLLWHLRCNVICYDMYPNQHLLDLGAKYVSLDDLISQSMIISLNCPLTEETYHLINEQSISKMQDGVMIVNTGRGALVDSAAVLQVCTFWDSSLLFFCSHPEQIDLKVRDLFGVNL